MFCSRCGQQNPDDASFCMKCGKQITSSPMNKTENKSTDQQKVENSENIVNSIGDKSYGKTILIFIVAAIFLFLVFIAIDRNSGSALISSFNMSSNEKEAVRIAKKCFEARGLSVRCGDMTYVRANLVDEIYSYRKFKGQVYIKIKTGYVDEIDKMNGIEWRGEVSMHINGPSQFATPYKYYGEWERSGMNPATFRIRKKNGKWETDYPGSGGEEISCHPPFPSMPPLTCEEAEKPTTFRHMQ